MNARQANDNYHANDPRQNDHNTRPPMLERLIYRMNDLSVVLGVSRRTIERERSAGRFPLPDLRIGKAPLWRVETIREWIGRNRRTLT